MPTVLEIRFTDGLIGGPGHIDLCVSNTPPSSVVDMKGKLTKRELTEGELMGWVEEGMYSIKFSAQLPHPDYKITLAVDNLPYATFVKKIKDSRYGNNDNKGVRHSYITDNCAHFVCFVIQEAGLCPKGSGRGGWGLTPHSVFKQVGAIAKQRIAKQRSLLCLTAASVPAMVVGCIELSIARLEVDCAVEKASSIPMLGPRRLEMERLLSLLASINPDSDSEREIQIKLEDFIKRNRLYNRTVEEYKQMMNLFRKPSPFSAKQLAEATEKYYGDHARNLTWGDEHELSAYKALVAMKTATPKILPHLVSQFCILNRSSKLGKILESMTSEKRKEVKYSHGTPRG